MLPPRTSTYTLSTNQVKIKFVILQDSVNSMDIDVNLRTEPRQFIIDFAGRRPWSGECATLGYSSVCSDDVCHVWSQLGKN